MADYGFSLLAGALACLAAVAAAWCLIVVARRRMRGTPTPDVRQGYHALGETSPDAMLINRGNEIVYANAAALKLLGASAAHQIVGRAALDFVHVDDLPAVHQRIQRVMKDGPLPGLWEQRFVRLDGSIVDVEVNVGMIMDRGVVARQVVIRDISARKRMEEQLRQSEVRYRKLVETSPDATFIIRDVRIDYANAAALRLLGASTAEQVVGKPILTFVHPDCHAAARERIDYVDRTGQGSSLRETRYVRLDGSVVDVEISATMIMDEGTPARHVVVRDISARKRVEQALRFSEERYRMLVESSPDATLIYRGDTVEFANAAALKLFGASTPGQVVGHAQSEFLHKDFSAAGQQSGLWEQKFVRLDGSTFDAEGSSTPIVDQRGAMRQVILRDISARKRAEFELEISRRRHQDLLEGIPDVAYLKSRDGTYVTANRAWSARHGVPLDGIYGKTDRDIFPAKRAQGNIEEDARVVSSRKELRVERVFEINGEVRWSETIKTPLIDEHGAVIGTVGVARDITERRRAEAALRESEARLKAIIDNSAALISLRDPQGRYMLVNRCYAELMNLTPDQFVGKTPDTLLPAEVARQISDEHRSVLETRAPATSEVRVMTRDGERVLISNKFALLDSKGEPYAVCCVGTDITQHERDAETLRRVNEELSLKAQELTALNKELEAFSYSVSHDLRAPLRHIDGFVNMLREQVAPAPDSPARHYMQRIEGASSTMTHLIDDLLTFSRAGRGVLNKIPLALDRMVADIIEDLKPDIGARSVEWHIGVLPVVCGDRNLLRQVFFNLIENAVKYTRPQEAARIDISCVTEASDVIIAIRDNGVGFDMQYAHKLFGVFQRLHSAEEFEGTGIGLANVARIIQRHAGRVWAEAEKGRGAAFFVALPSGAPAQS